jgi:AraC-like DNA-binding protein
MKIQFSADWPALAAKAGYQAGQLACQCGLTPRHLQRIFRQRFACSPQFTLAPPPHCLPHPRLTPQAPSPRFTHNPLENAGDNRYETGYIPTVRMKSSTQVRNPAQVQRWARRLDVRVGKVLAAHPHADPDNVRHTLILLEQPPLERLQRSLIRGRATAIFRK